MHLPRSRRAGFTARAASAGPGLLVSIACLVSACTHPVQPAAEAPPPPLTAPYAASARAGADVYQLAPAASTVWILVDKAGPLASLGHRHVITVHGLQGFARVVRDSHSQADLRFPAARLEVDGPAALAHFHENEKLSPQDRAGTRRHMLGTSVLDAGRFPWVRLHIDVPRTTRGAHRALAVTIHLHGKTRTLETTANLERTNSGWRISGAFPIKQSAFGITPYSIMLGALRVRDRIEIRYHLSFLPWPGSSHDTRASDAQPSPRH